jgi:nitroreductase
MSLLACTVVTDGEESNMSRTWQVDAADFPVGGDVTDLLRFVLRYATLSPSSHNSQPWLFHRTDTRSSFTPTTRVAFRSSTQTTASWS